MQNAPSRRRRARSAVVALGTTATLLLPAGIASAATVPDPLGAAVTGNLAWTAPSAPDPDERRNRRDERNEDRRDRREDRRDRRELREQPCYPNCQGKSREDHTQKVVPGSPKDGSSGRGKVCRDRLGNPIVCP